MTEMHFHLSHRTIMLSSRLVPAAHDVHLSPLQAISWETGRDANANQARSNYAPPSPTRLAARLFETWIIRFQI